MRLDCEMTVMCVIKSMFDSLAKCLNNLYLMSSQYQAAELINFVHLNKQVFFYCSLLSLNSFPS